MLLDCIDKALRAALEASVMEEDNHPRPSSVTPEFVDRALAWGHRALIEDECRIALQLGRQEGREVGREEGLLLGRREILVRLLARGGLRPDTDEARRIDGCDDLAILDRWIDQAIGAASVVAALR